jgi:serine/threonine protein kinase
VPHLHRELVLSTGPTPTRIGPVAVEARLGAGGMGVVYRGVHGPTGRKVAVKVLKASGEGGEAETNRFLREVKYTASLAHPNIIGVLDVGRTAQGELFYVMELLEGESLSERIKREQRLPAMQVVPIARQVCAALGAAHAQGIVHRDVKPANVMLVPQRGAAPLVKVVDFGIARAVGRDAAHDTALTGTGVAVGTLQYMAPEQLLGVELDGRADVYALGAMLFQALTGTHLFPGKDTSSLLYHQVNTRPELACERAPDANIPTALARVIARCLEKDPVERYADMAQLDAALVAALESPDDAVDLSGVPFWRCASCSIDLSRHTSHCSRCGAYRDAPEQQRFMRQFIAERREAERAEAQARAHALQQHLAAPPVSTLLPQARHPLPDWLVAFFRTFSLEAWGRLLGLAVVVALIFAFLGIDSVRYYSVLGLFAALATLGLWSNTR